MKPLIISICFILLTLPLAKTSMASDVDYEVREETREVWFLPKLLIKNTIWITSRAADPVLVNTEIAPYTAPSNQQTIQDILARFPGYQVRMYGVRPVGIEFQFVEAHTEAFSFSENINSGWQATSYKKVSKEKWRQIRPMLQAGPGLVMTVSYYANGQRIEVAAEAEYAVNFVEI